MKLLEIPKCDISGNTEKVEICSPRCGLRPAAKYEPAFSRGHWEGTVTGVTANAFAPNINSTNGTMSMKAEFS